MSMWTMTMLAVVVIWALAWLLIRLLLAGPNLAAFDQPVARDALAQRAVSPEHAQVVDLVQTATAELLAAPKARRLAVLRRIMARGFFDSPPTVDEGVCRIQTTEAGGAPAEWVLAPVSDPRRRLLYLHGGSFVSGSPQGHRAVTTQLAQATGAAVLALDYRLLPEHTRREQLADCQAGYRWLLEHGPDGVAPVRQLFLAGDSSGASLVLTLLAWARDHGLRAADGAIVLSPTVDMTLSSPTLKSNRPTDPVMGATLGALLALPRSFLLVATWILHRIIPSNPLVSPIFGDLKGLPPTLIQVSAAEMMLGDARRYANKARAAGSPVELEIWPALVHVWHLFAPLLPEAREAFDRIGRFVERCAAQDPSSSQPR